MSVEAMAVALHHSRATGTTKLVLLGIANHDGDGGAWPSVETLTKYANTSIRSVQYALRKLEQIGEIRTHIRGGGLPRTADHERPNLYDFLLTCPAECDGTKHHRPRVVQAVAPGVVQPVAPRVVQLVAPEPSFEPPRELTPRTPTGSSLRADRDTTPQNGHSRETTGRQLIAEWVRSQTERPDDSDIGYLGKEVRGLLDSGVTPDAIRRALVGHEPYGSHRDLPVAAYTEWTTEHADITPKVKTQPQQRAIFGT